MWLCGAWGTSNIGAVPRPTWTSMKSLASNAGWLIRQQRQRHACTGVSTGGSWGRDWRACVPRATYQIDCSTSWPSHNNIAFTESIQYCLVWSTSWRLTLIHRRNEAVGGVNPVLLFSIWYPWLTAASQTHESPCTLILCRVVGLLQHRCFRTTPSALDRGLRC